MKKFGGTAAFLSIVLLTVSAQASLTTSQAVLAAQTEAAALSPSDRPNVEFIPATLQTAGAREVIRCTGGRVQRVAESTTGDYGMFGAPALYVWLVMMSGGYIGMSAAMCIEAN